ncbi:MAG: precorrin-2 C(20)-methyltransferase [Peptococcaceae bacterium]|nr:precorrin-2 C(20)-methyltransferase [Peptococcaceae bacterium]MDH7525798.1 precorrin-2 C(20)-methyltransferase [Peptococcaceae bacterium]
MPGVFYGVGVGPGDPELVTVKAARTIREAAVVIAPRAGQKEESMALTIARPYLKDAARVVLLDFPMVGDRELLAESWRRGERTVLAHLERGENVVFLTLGDPMLYGTYSYIYKAVSASGYQVCTIPGITSFSAAASRAGIPLVQGDEVLSIVPAAAGRETLARVLEIPSNLVLMKAHNNLREISGLLEAAGLLDDAVLVSKCGFEDEKIYRNLRELGEKKVSYFSTIIVKRK